LELYPLADTDKVKMLRKLALFWDGQWFLHSVERFGLEEGIALNAAVRMIATHTDLLLGPGVRASYEVEAHRARVVVRRCAAFEGAKRANLARQDQACVTCETLWDAWFEALLPSTKISVRYPQRQGMGAAVCEFLIAEDR
jgi:hypothetical protein